MKMTEIRYGDQRPVESYGPGGFRIGQDWVEGSVALLPSAMVPLETPLSAEGLARVIAEADALDVVLIGQGAEIAPLAPEIRAAFEAAGIGVEAMSTPSACRTYNVLLAEARRVGAVLVAV